MSRLIFAAAAAFALTSAAASAATIPDPNQHPKLEAGTQAHGSGGGAGKVHFTLDAKGKCHDASGKFAAQTKCTAPPAAPPRCRDPKTGKFVKCVTPGAQTVHLT
jgi:hypothetical protein